MLVSILMTTFNHESYIINAVESILNQTYQNIELIIVDDGSKYNINDKLVNYKTDKIKIINLDSVGPSKAINIGISESKGECIALFSGDDMASINRISSQVKALRDRENVLLFSVPNIIDIDGSLRSDDVCPFLSRSKSKKIRYDHIRGFFYEGNHLCAPTAFAKRSVFDKIGEFHEGLIQLQDFDYWIRALKKGITFEIKGDRLIDYRYRSDGSNLSSYKSAAKANIEVNYLLKDFFSGFDPETLCQAFQNETFFVFETNQLTVELNTPIWMLCHPDPEIRRFGYELIIDYTRDPRKSKLLSKLGLNNPSISKIMGAW